MTIPRPSLRLAVLALAALLALAAVLALAIVGAQPAAAQATAGPCSAAPAAGTYDVGVTSGGLQRSALVHVPRRIPVGAPVPLVLALHGAYGTGPGMQSYTGFSHLADTDDFIVAYPDSVGDFWNIGAAASQPDDVAFISDLIGALESAMCIDSSRVFAAGVSNGAGMVALLGCDLSNQLAGIAAVAGDYDKLPPCHLKRPVPLLEIHGTSDHVAPYRGHRGRRTATGLPSFVNAWARRDRCVGSPASQDIATRTVLFSWGTCAQASTVEHVRIVGGRHQWPGATPPDPGPPATICASCMIWNFFSTLGPQQLPPLATGGASPTGTRGGSPPAAGGAPA